MDVGQGICLGWIWLRWTTPKVNYSLLGVIMFSLLRDYGFSFFSTRIWVDFVPWPRWFS